MTTHEKCSRCQREGVSLRVTDSQVHIWEAPTLERPWPARGPDYAHGPRFSADELLGEMDRAGVDRAVLIPPSFEGDYNDLCLQAAASHPDRFGIMGRIDAGNPSNREVLPTWREQPGMLGIRLTFARGPSERWLQDGTVDWLWQEAEQHQIPIMVFAPKQVPFLGKVARRHPGLTLIVDHLGLEMNLSEQAIDTVVEQVVALAEYPNIAVKATCVPRYSLDAYPFRSMHDRIRRVVDAFGSQRVFWGSDLSRLPGPYSEAIRLFVEELDFLTVSDLESILGRGIEAWLRWPR